MMCGAYDSQLFFDVFRCNHTVKIWYALDNESTIAFKCVIQLLLNV